jgi:hypothetical protein
MKKQKCHRLHQSILQRQHAKNNLTLRGVQKTIEEKFLYTQRQSVALIAQCGFNYFNHLMNHGKRLSRSLK